MKWCTFVLVAALACAWALPSPVSAAQAAGLIIDPPSGGAGSRFQIVGEAGWIPGETVRLRAGFTTGDPVSFTGPYAIEQAVTVLADGTWSFPVVLSDAFFGGAAPATPGTVVVRAESPSQQVTATFTYTGIGPPPASEVASAGFGPGAAGASAAVIAALFASGVGAMLLVGGTARRREAL